MSASGRQDGCIAICWLVTLRAQMGLESPRRAHRRWNEIRGTEVEAGFMCSGGKKREKHEDENGARTFFSLTTRDEKPSGLSGGASSTNLVAANTCQRDFTISLVKLFLPPFSFLFLSFYLPRSWFASYFHYSWLSSTRETDLTLVRGEMKRLLRVGCR